MQASHLAQRNAQVTVGSTRCAAAARSQLRVLAVSHHYYGAFCRACVRALAVWAVLLGRLWSSRLVGGLLPGLHGPLCDCARYLNAALVACSAVMTPGGKPTVLVAEKLGASGG